MRRSIVWAAAAMIVAANANAAQLQTFKKNSTSRSVEITILDNTTGLPVTGLAFNASGIDLEYCREGAACTDITEATQTVGGAWSSGGFVDKGKGVYRLDVPDAALATGVNSVGIQGSITGYIVIGGTIKLVDYDPEDAVRMGVTALPNAAAEATGGLYTRGTNAGQINQPANGRIDVGAIAWNGVALATTNPLPNAASGASGGLPVNGTGANQIALASGGVVTAGTVSDKTGYALSTAGRDAILLGQGIPAPTTIATLASQTSFTLTAGSADDNAYNGYGIIIRDSATAAQQALGCVRDYTGSTKTITLLQSPGIFTMATTDNVQLLPAYCDALVQQSTIDTALVNCRVNTAFFAGSTTTVACILTDKYGTAITSSSNKLTGLELIVLSGAQQYEKRFIQSTSWDSTNSELRLTLSRAEAATLADDVTAIIR